MGLIGLPNGITSGEVFHHTKRFYNAIKVPQTRDYHSMELLLYIIIKGLRQKGAHLEND